MARSAVSADEAVTCIKQPPPLLAALLNTGPCLFPRAASTRGCALNPCMPGWLQDRATMLQMASLVAMVAGHAPDMVVPNTDKLVASLERGLELLQVGGWG
jgi:hypothetical protein